MHGMIPLEEGFLLHMREMSIKVDGECSLGGDEIELTDELAPMCDIIDMRAEDIRHTY